MTQELVALETQHPLRIDYWAGQTDKLVVVFSGVGKQPSEYPPVEFFNSATQNGQNHALFIRDISRSWMNADGIDIQILSVVMKVAAEKSLTDITLLGDSMGGSMALFLADIIPASTVLAFVRNILSARTWYRKNRDGCAFDLPFATINIGKSS